MKVPSQLVLFIGLLIAIYLHKQTFSETSLEERELQTTYGAKVDKAFSGSDRYVTPIHNLFHGPSSQNLGKQKRDYSASLPLDSLQTLNLFEKMDKTVVRDMENR
ncbi:MAG: hypothetical protein AAFX53_08910 [Bacteroidota bacterium]